MREIEIAIPTDQTPTGFAKRIVKLLAAEGLRIALKGELRQYPGCTHWHFRHATLPGTLELTFWPRERRLWFTIQSRRQADWIDPIVKRVKAALTLSSAEFPR